MSLTTNNNFHEPNVRVYRSYRPADEFYEALINMHRGLNDEQSMAVNARLVLLLSNHIGDLNVLREAMTVARAEIDSVANTKPEKAE